ncbi:MAG TPA: hypothetical protein DCQ58_04585 [Saprospirales bacterium]|nr:hypothetical protein [Saprospirales bacterium]
MFSIVYIKGWGDKQLKKNKLDFSVQIQYLSFTLRSLKFANQTCIIPDGNCPYRTKKMFYPE